MVVEFSCDRGERGSLKLDLGGTKIKVTVLFSEWRDDVHGVGDNIWVMSNSGGVE